MSKPIPAINRYKADLREFAFLLFEQFRLDELLGKQFVIPHEVIVVESNSTDGTQFGQVTQVKDPRLAQFALKFYF